MGHTDKDGHGLFSKRNLIQPNVIGCCHHGAVFVGKHGEFGGCNGQHTGQGFPGATGKFDGGIFHLCPIGKAALFEKLLQSRTGTVGFSAHAH